MARGHRYGTIVVDLEKQRPIELLAGRDAATVVAWLKEQPAVEVIARDRSGAYADAARTAASGAQQVADRWHLLANLRDAFERVLLRCPANASPDLAKRLLQRPLQVCPPLARQCVGGKPDHGAMAIVGDDHRAAASHETSLRACWRGLPCPPLGGLGSACSSLARRGVDDRILSRTASASRFRTWEAGIESPAASSLLATSMTASGA